MKDPKIISLKEYKESKETKEFKGLEDALKCLVGNNKEVEEFFEKELGIDIEIL